MPGGGRLQISPKLGQVAMVGLASAGIQEGEESEGEGALFFLKFFLLRPDPCCKKRVYLLLNSF